MKWRNKIAIIRKYNLKDLEINKKEINQKFFKNNKNSKILDTFNENPLYFLKLDNFNIQSFIHHFQEHSEFISERLKKYFSKS